MERRTAQTWVDGLVAGLLGYSAVAAFFLLFNLLAGRPPFYTAEALGTVLAGGGGAGAVLAFNGLHMAVSMGIGVVASWLVHETELHPRHWFAFFFLFVAGFFFTSVGAGLLAAELSDAAPWWAVLLSNALAAGLAGGYLWVRHPGLARMAQAGSGASSS